MLLQLFKQSIKMSSADIVKKIMAFDGKPIKYAAFADLIFDKMLPMIENRIGGPNYAELMELPARKIKEIMVNDLPPFGMLQEESLIVGYAKQIQANKAEKKDAKAVHQVKKTLKLTK